MLAVQRDIDHFVVDHPEALALRGSVAVFIDSAGKYALFDNTGVAQLNEGTDDEPNSASA
jgi:hypothetical protein